jgi:GMP synthase-like glutamine amidotransferase
VLAVELTPAAATDPVFASLPPSFATLQWHGESYELPPGAVQLARSRDYEQQAFVVGRAYALQFHLEVDAELAGEWMRTPAFVAELERDQGAGAPAALLAQMQALEDRSVPLARELFARWLLDVVGYREDA